MSVVLSESLFIFRFFFYLVLFLDFFLPKSSLFNIVCIRAKRDRRFVVAANTQPPTNPVMGHSPSLMGGSTSPGPGGLQPSLQGVKVPDENLTPQQRQHRENQLANLRKIEMMLFTDKKDDCAGPLDQAQGTPPSSGPPTNVPAVSCPGQCPTSMDWHKLQNQFLDGKNKVRDSGLFSSKCF